ncbi:MAG TPA: thioredoxin family protein [Cyclobacteriaceae bacterium]|nr:thioredoxin family protein [Cyclobacteriaceae bacterium]
MKKVWVVSVLLLIASFVEAQIHDNAEEAFASSKATHKPVLLIFSGSDWCAPCIRFQKTVLSDEQFQLYASDHLILLKADFPQRKKLSKALEKQNEVLAEKYNPKGQFPHIVLLNSDQSVLSTLSYKNQDTAQFISMLSTYFAE